jgi:hypothetical protein
MICFRGLVSAVDECLWMVLLAILMTISLVIRKNLRQIPPCTILWVIRTVGHSTWTCKHAIHTKRQSGINDFIMLSSLEIKAAHYFINCL